MWQLENLKVKNLFLQPVMNSSILRHLPNLLTTFNLFCGCLAVVFVFSGNIPVFSVLIAASLIFDFLDGFTARRLNAYSDIGKELDSLADMVTFGLVPGAIMYHLFINSVPYNLLNGGLLVKTAGFLPFIITVFSALRLAKFNIDTRQTASFLGMPTPAVTIFTCGLALVIEYDTFHLTPLILNSYFLAGVSMVICFLLVSEIPLFALKFPTFSIKDNRLQYSFLLLCIVAFVLLKFNAVPVIIILYLVLSLLFNRNKV
jgi:CDP-diacylglycerol---serine O-phosphatidyltransferase